MNHKHNHSLEKKLVTVRIEILEAEAVEECRILALVPPVHEGIAELVGGRVLNSDLKNARSIIKGRKQ